VYWPTSAISRLVWVSRQGSEQFLNDVPRAYKNPRVAADGNRVAVQTDDLWIQDVARASFTRLTSNDTSSAAFPIWSSDGRQVVYRTASGIAIRAADGSGQRQAVAGTTEWDYPAAMTADGETLIFLRASQETSFDILATSLKDPRSVRTILKTPAYEGGAKLSPDEHWLVYVSNDSGRNEIYLRPYPGPDRRWPVSTDGGTQPLWNPNGKEIFYRSANKMMAVDVKTTPDVVLSTPRLLFEGRYAFGAGITIANYDVSNDGQRFIMVKDDASAARLNVVLNWTEELRQRVPVK
jgi:serine/threonine-protein kinase